MPLSRGSNRPRLCKNVFEHVRCSKLDWKSRFYAKSTSADVPINFRFNVDADTSILAKRFYTLWANSCLSRPRDYDQKRAFAEARFGCLEESTELGMIQLGCVFNLTTVSHRLL